MCVGLEQVNEAQLKASAAITTSRPPFRPMSLNLGPTPSAAPMGRQTYRLGSHPSLIAVNSERFACATAEDEEWNMCESQTGTNREQERETERERETGRLRATVEYVF
jgi:hypothetical protein